MLQRFPVLQHIVNYLGVAIASKFVPIASIFLYSHLMSVQDFGVLNLAASYLWIFGIVMTLNLHTGVGRYIYTEQGDFARFLGTTLMAIAAVFLGCALVILVNLGHFEQLLALPRGVIVLTLVIVPGSVAESLFTQIAIHSQKSMQLFKVTVAKAMGTLVLSLVLLQVLEEDKYLGVLYADAMVSTILAAFVLYRVRENLQLKFSTKHLGYMVRYSVPLIPYMLCLTLLSQFDRVMIDRFFGKEATGLYSLAYNVGILLLMLMTAVLNVFTPAFFDGLNKKDYSLVARDSDSIFALAVLITAGLVLFGEEIFGLLVPAKYAPALDLIPVVAIGGLCFVIFQIWVRVVAYVNKTYLISIIAVVATILKIGLNVFLLPIFGYKIAAVTTIIAYLAMSLLCVGVLNSVIRIFKVDVMPDLAYLLALICLLLFFAYAHLPPAIEYALKGVLLMVIAIHLKPKILALVVSKRGSSETTA